MSIVNGFRCNRCGKIVDLDLSDGFTRKAVRIPQRSVIGGTIYGALDFCDMNCFEIWLEDIFEYGRSAVTERDRTGGEGSGS